MNDQTRDETEAAKTLRIPKYLLNALEIEAKRTFRSVNGLIAALCVSYLDLGDVELKSDMVDKARQEVGGQGPRKRVA